jgi:hypothetical protein
MYLLKKINEATDDFEFSKILAGEYDINEQPNLISQKQMVNGQRKKIITNYTDVVIDIKLSGLEAEDIAEYLTNLTDGEYQYWNIADAEYKNANFIVDLPKITIEKAFSADKIFFDDFKVGLEKSSDVEEVSV